jgi:hypothetical protein
MDSHTSNRIQGFFRGLPAEIRIEVYKHINISYKKHYLSQFVAGLPDHIWPGFICGLGDRTIMVIRPSLPVALLRTNRLIHSEAAPIFEMKFLRLSNTPLKIVLDWPALEALAFVLGPPPTFPVWPLVTQIRAVCRSFLEGKPVYGPGPISAPLRGGTDVAVTITRNYLFKARNPDPCRTCVGVEQLRKITRDLDITMELAYEDTWLRDRILFGAYRWQDGITLRVKFVELPPPAFLKRMQELEEDVPSAEQDRQRFLDQITGK